MLQSAEALPDCLSDLESLVDRAGIDRSVFMAKLDPWPRESISVPSSLLWYHGVKFNISSTIIRRNLAAEAYEQCLEK